MRTPEYRCWDKMIQRCCNPNSNSYKNYGGRGIKVCLRWRVFSNFLADMRLKPSAKHSIERRENDGNYEPGNCYWASRAIQLRNKRNNRRITFSGETMVLQDWAARVGIKAFTIGCRLDRGWSVKDALTLPANKSMSCSRYHKAKQAARTHCLHGHEFTARNTYWKQIKGTGTIAKLCRECARLRAENNRKKVLDRK